MTTNTRRVCVLVGLLSSVAGCGGGSSSSSAENQVSGRILDADGRPAAGVFVRIGGTSTTTGSDGRFAVADVLTPYDLHVGGVGNVVSSYLGLTLRTLPDLHRMGGPEAPPPETATATLTGTITGGSMTAAPDRRVRVLFCAEGEGGCASTIATAQGSYMLLVTVGAPTVTGKLLAVEATYDADGAPTAWGQLAVASATVWAGATTWQGLVLSTPLGSRTITGTLQAAAGMDGVDVFYTFSDDTSGWQVHHVYLTPGSALGVVLPDLPGYTAHYSAQWLGLGGYGSSFTWGTIAGDVLTIDLPAPAALVAPVSAAVGVTSATDFTWTPRAGAVHRWGAACAGGTVTRYVRTTGDTARLVALAGYPLPAGATCSWNVWTYEPFTSLDAYVVAGASTALNGTETSSERRLLQLQ